MLIETHFDFNGQEKTPRIIRFEIEKIHHFHCKLVFKVFVLSIQTADYMISIVDSIPGNVFFMFKLVCSFFDAIICYSFSFLRHEKQFEIFRDDFRTKNYFR